MKLYLNFKVWKKKKQYFLLQKLIMYIKVMELFGIKLRVYLKIFRFLLQIHVSYFYLVKMVRKAIEQMIVGKILRKLTLMAFMGLD